MSVTERMAEFIVETNWADFPELVTERAKKAVVDTVGVTLAGVNEPVGRTVADFARKMGGAPEAGIIGSGARAAAPLAALANGAMGHALDFDDSSYLLSGHPSVVVLPAVLAQGEAQGASGREVLEAFIIGYEISTKLGQGLNPNTTARAGIPPARSARWARRPPPPTCADSMPRRRATRSGSRPLTPRAFTRTSAR